MDREIPQAEAEGAVTAPERVAPLDGSRQFFMRRYFDKRLGQEMLLRVLVKETSQARTIITVYTTSKIGKYMKETTP